jgi:hypothetical protein
MDELKDDIRSRIWCTYRKNFSAIGEYKLSCSIIIIPWNLWITNLLLYTY